MQRRRAWVLAAAFAAGGAASSAATAPEAYTAAVAKRRAQALEARADAAADPARRAQLREAAVAARVAAAEADMAILRARATTLARRVADQRTRLAVHEAPVARMLATLAALSRRPPIVALAQPGSITDLVHARAVFAATLPVLRARSAALRAEVARGRIMQASAADAERRLRAGRARLVEAREQLAAVTGGDDDRALAMEEAVRDTAERLTAIGSEQAVLADVMALAVPPVPPASRRAEGAYRLPVRGRLVTGLGEMSGNGVRARGLTIAVPAATPVVAPAGGRIRYAGAFRSFGQIVIVDHGAGWASLLTGLGRVAVRPGAMVAAGAPLGTAPAVDGARVTVELRRRGRPVEITPLLG
ncbi:murein DD-endopeptidase MepM/ murein hydrolase activator NlpD [Sphingomonas sp. BE138]|uniref:murein hydrolase activator EnvC family protein n=1 Tax=Sphingomonas sp. BE138 TaxID=2817845 RepID=UPI00285A1D34|nr:peptidoglycan DD-metalloendopeptidase family protein [Sphingomonas sp. BE138]MDR6787842.1 murein DD-endopeptidase MepM/ murein hydrolase activator NlpD [Sphingomonas sp. BE138]